MLGYVYLQLKVTAHKNDLFEVMVCIGGIRENFRNGFIRSVVYLVPYSLLINH